VRAPRLTSTTGCFAAAAVARAVSHLRKVRVGLRQSDKARGASGFPASLAVGAVPTGLVDTPQNVKSFRVYDSANRLAWSIDGNGGVTHYGYDGKGQVVETISYAKRINMATWVVDTAPVVTLSARNKKNGHP
jgi:YD repeat-containing protein